MAQCISAFEGAALAHQSNVHACAAQPTNGKIPWLWDTAAGRHLIGRQALDGEMKRCLQPSQNPVAFSTGGGPQPSQDSLGFRGSAILKDEEAYVLKECPPAQSIGKTVVDKGYIFVWDPREKVPYHPPLNIPYRMVSPRPWKQPFLLPFCGDVWRWEVSFCNTFPTEILLRKIGFFPFVSVDDFFAQIVYFNRLDF